ncbi:hypothetical protein V6615_09055 [Oscillospiraceae bacterium PP1C4]
MNFMKKSLALGMAVLMAGSFAACSGADTKWVAKSGDMTVPSGVYIWGLMNQYYDATSKLGAEVKKPLQEKIDGVPVPEKIVTGAKEDLAKYIAVEKKFSELKLSFDAATQAALTQNVDSYWQYIGDSYEKNGISKDSYALMFANDAKRAQIFQAIYGEGGSEQVPDSELKDKFLKDYAKIIVIPLNFSTSEDPAQKEKDNKTAKEMIAKYEQKFKAGESMEDLAFEAQKEISKDPSSLTKPEAGASYTFVSRDNSPYAENVTKAIFDAKNGVATVAETDESIYLFVRYDISENENDFVSRKSAILSQLKNEELTNRIAEWAKGLTDVTYNEASLKRYTPDKLKI